MKTLTPILFLCVTFLGYNAKAQLVVATKLQAVYSGTDNYLDFALKNVSSADVELKANHGELRRDTFNTLIWRSCDRIKHRLILRAYNKKTRKIIDSTEILVRELPIPVVLTSFSSHFSNNSRLDKLRGILATQHEISYDVRYKIIKADITVITRTGHKTVTNYSGDFSDETREVLRNTNEGDTIVIDNVYVQFGCETKNRRIASDLKYVHKDGVHSVVK